MVYTVQSENRSRDETLLHAAAAPKCPTVSTGAFNGPLELLVHLVNTQEVDIYQVSLCQVVDDFLQVVFKTSLDISLDTSTQFLLYAAILLEIKSRCLLPQPPSDDQGEKEMNLLEQRDLLLNSLLSSRTYARVARHLSGMIETAGLSLPRSWGLDTELVWLAPDLLDGVSPEDLRSIFGKVIENSIPLEVDLAHISVDSITVTDVAEELSSSLPNLKNVTFFEITSHLSERIEVIVWFLALLELCKTGQVVLDQGELFGELHIKWIGDYENG
ncbi:MAG: segregation/condensation protein A [Actinobacteria bacterium]|nr:segregation/condensation protein A [Actinomycetota bacterium]MCL6105383.1 segregation/condensation protein A [Actinomycetota bacterium]